MLCIPVLMSCNLIDPEDNPGIGEDAKAITLTRSEAELTAHTNTTGFELFKSLYKENPASSMMISPLSLSLALSMTANGAAGQTQEQMIDILGFDNVPMEQVNDYFKKMVEALKTADKSTVFETANSVWVGKGINLKKGFSDNVSKYYDATALSRDFDQASTLKEINGWCSDKTKGKIDSILDHLDGGCTMLLMNALYFKGIWRKQFTDAGKGSFKSATGKSQNVQMMSITDNYLYTDSDNFQMVEIPYGNNAFSMVVILPSESIGMDGFISSTLCPEFWEKAIGNLASYRVNVRLPEFKIEYGTELQDILGKMGMTLAISPMADFSNLSDTAMMIDFIKQKTFIDVNRKGTEAAAVTAIGMKCTSAGPDETKYFNADRPFIFAIRERSTGAILFIGQKC